MKLYDVAYLYKSKFGTIESEVIPIEALKLAKEHHSVPDNVIDFKVL